MKFLFAFALIALSQLSSSAQAGDPKKLTCTAGEGSTASCHFMTTLNIDVQAGTFTFDRQAYRCFEPGLDVSGTIKVTYEDSLAANNRVLSIDLIQADPPTSVRGGNFARMIYSNQSGFFRYYNEDGQTFNSADFTMDCTAE